MGEEEGGSGEEKGKTHWGRTLIGDGEKEVGKWSGDGGWWRGYTDFLVRNGQDEYNPLSFKTSQNGSKTVVIYTSYTRHIHVIYTSYTSVILIIVIM
jgi:hypothetical protein